MKKILFFFPLALLVIAIIIPSFLPKKTKAEAETTFDYPVEKVFEAFNHQKEFTQWNPWLKQDSLVQLSFFQPYKGKGALYTWESENKRVGKGSMEILESTENEYIKTELRMDGQKENAYAEMFFETLSDSKTKVRWTFDSPESSYFLRYKNLIFGSLITKSYKDGFTFLEEHIKNSENKVSSKEDSTAYELAPGKVLFVDYSAQKMLGKFHKSKTDVDKISSNIETSIDGLADYVFKKKNISKDSVGHFSVYYQKFDTISNSAEYYVGIPIHSEISANEDYEIFATPSSKAIATIHKGSYSTLEETYHELSKLAELQQMELKPFAVEEYLNDPKQVKEEELETKIYLPVR